MFPYFSLTLPITPSASISHPVNQASQTGQTSYAYI